MLPLCSPPIAEPAAGDKRKSRKPRKTRRTTRQYVPFEEMIRLMTQYGPIKSARKRKNKGNTDNDEETGGSTKMESIKRKFYRWFPDFEERFVKETDGIHYRPKEGHDGEVAYRLAMRNKDQKILTHKRKVGRMMTDNRVPLLNGK